MRIRSEVVPFLVVVLLGSVLLYGLLVTVGVPITPAWISALLVLIVSSGYLLWFFRNPTRVPPADETAILAAADGVVAVIKTFDPDAFSSISMLAGLNPADLGRLRTEPVTRISIFLSLFNVHVNRLPISGESRFLGYFPGKHLFTFEEKSSDVNQHNSILVSNDRTVCLVNQIVGPLCRRVVYWLAPDRSVAVKAGDAFGMMKFGSRLDMYFPSGDIELLVKEGERVQAGLSIIARYV